MEATGSIAAPDWVLVVSAARAGATPYPQARAFALSDPDGVANQEVDPRARFRQPPRAVVVEAHHRPDELPGLLRYLDESGLRGLVPTLLAAPLGVVRSLEDAPVDDFVVAPYARGEIVERVRRLLQRRGDVGGYRWRVGGLALDPASQRVAAFGRRVALTRLEFGLLSFFVEHPDQVFTREQLLAEVWTQSLGGRTRTVDIHVRRLRAKLGRAVDSLETVRGVGYRFVA